MIRAAQLIPAAGYIRMSTDQQTDSPERQKMEINQLAERLGCTVIEWLEDHGQTGTESKKRKSFQKMMADAGKAKWRAVLATELSRISREEVWEAITHLRTLFLRGVRVATGRRGWIDLHDLGSLITVVVDCHANHDESIKIADRSVSGRRLMLERGGRVGPRLLGFDREFTQEGVVVHRAHYLDHFLKPKGWRVRIVPSVNVDEVEAVQWAFRKIAEGGALSEVRSEFRRRGILTRFGNRFDYQNVRTLLQNSVYCGDLVVAKTSKGKFRRLNDGNGPIVKRDAHPAIVSRQLFDDVQKQVAVRRRPWTRPIAGAFILSSLISCSHCHGSMYGSTQRRIHNSRPSRRKHPVRVYLCKNPDCPVRPVVQAAGLENWIVRLIERQFLNEETLDHVAAALDRRRASRNPTAAIDDQIEGLKGKVRRGEDNLALAESPEDFSSISESLKQWRIMLNRLEAERGKVMEGAQASQEATVTMRALNIPQLLEGERRWMLMAPLAATIKEIRIYRRWLNGKFDPCCVLYGEIEFKPGACDQQIFQFTDADVGEETRLFRKVASFIKSQNRPVRLFEIVNHFQVKHYTNLRRPLIRAVAEGSILSLGPRKGWVANPAYNPFAGIFLDKREPPVLWRVGA